MLRAALLIQARFSVVTQEQFAFEDESELPPLLPYTPPPSIQVVQTAPGPLRASRRVLMAALPPFATCSTPEVGAIPAAPALLSYH